MSLTAQAKILRAIEAKELYRLGGHVPIAVNVRILAATHRNLEEMAETGQFRRDLLFRLSVARVHLVPLRERREDIRIIARNCMDELNRELDTHVEDLSEELWQRLMDYAWPGNIRELRNMLESFLVQASSRTIAVEDLSAELLARLTAHRGQDERERLLTALMETRWNKSKAAEKLHWSRMTLYRKMTKYSFHPSAHHD
jgi:DNA-binding NtrC family response regulator